MRDLPKTKRQIADGPKMTTKAESRGRGRGASAPRKEQFEQVFERIYRLVLKIPRGRVMTYGQIARQLDDRYSPRLIGWAMHATPTDGRNIPWHRVINAKGGISTGRIHLEEPELQRYLLEAEGIVFDPRGHCDLSVYQWTPMRRKPRKQGTPTRQRQAKDSKSAARASASAPKLEARAQRLESVAKSQNKQSVRSRTPAAKPRAKSRIPAK